MGSEMCIRDSNKAFDVPVRKKPTGPTPLYDALVKYYGFDPLDEVF